jgi:hypothetical protein
MVKRVCESRRLWPFWTHFSDSRLVRLGNQVKFLSEWKIRPRYEMRILRIELYNVTTTRTWLVIMCIRKMHQVSETEWVCFFQANGKNKRQNLQLLYRKWKMSRRKYFHGTKEIFSQPFRKTLLWSSAHSKLATRGKQTEDMVCPISKFARNRHLGLLTKT